MHGMPSIKKEVLKKLKKENKMEPPSHPMLGTHRVELLHLMLQTLTSMGLQRTADSLREESGVAGVGRAVG